MAAVGVGMDLKVDINRIFNYFVSWSRNREKGMTVNEFYKKTKKKFPNMTRDIFNQYLDDLQRTKRVVVYPGQRFGSDYVIVNPQFRKKDRFF